MIAAELTIQMPVRLGLVLTSAVPLILFGALLVKLTSRGPVFYTQMRLGLGGRPYRIVKLRTMTHDCEKESGVRWSNVRWHSYRRHCRTGTVARTSSR